MSILVKELHALKYQLCGAGMYKISENGKIDHNNLVRWNKGILEQSKVDETTKRELRKILKFIDSEIEDTKTRVEELRKEKEGDEEAYKKALDELDNSEVTFEGKKIEFSKIGHFSFANDDDSACDYELVYDKFFE